MKKQISSNFHLVLFIFIMTLVNTGCRDEIVIPPVAGVSAEGAYVLSEGGFSAGAGKLSFYNLTAGTFAQNIFHPAALGLFPDGLAINNSNLYLTEQGNTGAAGKIYKLDSTGLVLTSASVGTNPYSLTITNNKVYLTNGPSGNVSVIKLSDFSNVTTVTVGVYPQEILAVGTKVFVCNTSIFGGATDSTISVIDAESDQVTATIKVRQTPSSLAVTTDGKLLAGCPGDASNGIIYKIDPVSYQKLDSFIISNGFAIGFSGDIAVDKNSSDIYFISYSNNITKLNLSTKTASVFIPNTNTATNYFYGYNFDSKNRKHYLANAGNFTAEGILQIYDALGNNTGNFTAGLFPRRIVIKN